MSDALSWIDSAKRPAHRILPNKIVRREYDFESQQYCENQRPTAWPFEPGKGEEQDGIHLIASCMQQQLLSCEPLERWKPGPPLVKVKEYRMRLSALAPPTARGLFQIAPCRKIKTTKGQRTHLGDQNQSG